MVSNEPMATVDRDHPHWEHIQQQQQQQHYPSPSMTMGAWKLSNGFMDGAHSPQNVSFYAFALGMVAMLGVSLTLQGLVPLPAGIYVSAIAIFHFLEYFATARWNGHKVTLASFLIDHSVAYHAANAAGLVEFLLEVWLLPTYKTISWWTWLGLAGVIAGQSIRTLAMATAGQSFNHLVQSQRANNHRLITTGVYSWFRHPSYFGFYSWALGMQLLLGNPICLCAFLVVLHMFFADRVAFEERALIRFFGDEYIAYKARVSTWMPFINGC